MTGSSHNVGEGADESEIQANKGDWVIRELVEVRNHLICIHFVVTDVTSTQRAASNLMLKLPDLHADALSRLYTIKSFQDKLGSLCLPEVKLSQRDCQVLAKYLSTKGICVMQHEVSQSAKARDDERG